jgi:DNA-nicking Smr family endonuclease
MQDDSNNNDDDSDLFQDAMDGVEPIKPDNKVKHKPEKKKIRVKHHHQDSIAIDDVFSDGHIEECPDQLSFSRSGVQPATLKKLRQGKLAIDNSIDLHGMTVDEARDYLLEFLGECELDGSRVLLIVHGKGYSSPGSKPIIKPMVNRWLRQLSSVLAFVSAKPADGGTGAVYVLLGK